MNLSSSDVEAQDCKKQTEEIKAKFHGIMFKFVVKRNSKELFHRAVAENDVLRVKMLLDDCKEDTKFNIDEINEDGLTALQNSCFIGNIEMVKLLVSYGGNLKIKDRDGWSLLHASVMAGNFSLVKFLVESGLNIISRTDKQEVAIDFAEDKEILIYLVKKMIATGSIEEVQAFIKRNPRYKKDIYKQIELSIKAKRDEIKALESFPITPREKKEKQVRVGKGGKKMSDGTKNHQHHQKVHHSRQSDIAKMENSSKPRLEKGHIRHVFTVDVDNLPETPAHRRWSSLTNLCESQKSNLVESKVKMHNGYDTDSTDALFLERFGVKRGAANGTHFQKRVSDQQEVDIVSVNSHSTSGYETDDTQLLYYTRRISYPEDKEVIKRVENNNEIDSTDYFQRSHTMSPRTMRRLEHRFGFSAVNDTNRASGNNFLKSNEYGMKTVEFPEVFL